MLFKIENLTNNRPVLLRLNSGQTLHLDPRRTSGEVLAVEIQRNAKVEKLVARRVIALHKVEEKKKTEPTEGEK